MSEPTAETIVFDNVSKFYGEVLGVNRVHLVLAPGITGLVGPNGSGKTTLMNLVTGLLKPSEGSIRVLDLPPDRPELLFSEIGYCTQYDAFPRGMSGYQFIYSFLRVHGYVHGEAERLTWKALERVNMTEAAHRRLDGYSKGMRQRVRVAQAISHEPRILVLDEPLNGLDPMARAEVSRVFEQLAGQGCHVIISSHILHEVDMFSDQVVFLSGGYVVAEGDVTGVRTDIEENKPIQVLVRCDKPGLVATRLFAAGAAVEVGLSEDLGGLLTRTRDPEKFYLLLNDVVLGDDVTIESVSVADANVRAVYQYLIGSEGEPR
ncbi:MAG TPA: ABC transporter ATP-binding protein [Thermoanaerobaculia bacterium]|jgi:ABC-2 type transport system ATP-binding protein